MNKNDVAKLQKNKKKIIEHMNAHPDKIQIQNDYKI